ncbi:unnamed protein product [Natator depressus]
MKVQTKPGELEERPRTAYRSRTEEKQEGLQPLEEQRQQEEYSLLMELFHFESEIQERTRKQRDQQKEQAKLQKEENRDRWSNLCYITQNQRFSNYPLLQPQDFWGCWNLIPY